MCFTLLRFERSGFHLAILRGFLSPQAIARYLLAIGHCLCFAFCGQSHLVPAYMGKIRPLHPPERRTKGKALADHVRHVQHYLEYGCKV